MSIPKKQHGMTQSPQLRALAAAFIAALLFGASTPLSKRILEDCAPTVLAGLMYLGSGIGILIVKVVQRATGGEATEARLARPDLRWLVLAVLSGGVAAPVILMFSLQNTPAATASLLLSFETVATTVLAAFVFHEFIGRRAWVAMLLVTAGSCLLSIEPDAAWGMSLGALGVIAACFLWGIDNNCTRNISAKDPLTIVMVKGIGAGALSLLLARWLGNPAPSIITIGLAMLLGLMSYGMSILLFIYAMRGLGGRAGQAPLFATSPLIGTVLSVVLFRESPGGVFLAALPVMLMGVAMLVTDRHEHRHIHESTTHEHRHDHADDHHAAHAAGGHSRSSHSHAHTHQYEVHEHQHLPDIHHRHGHDSAPAT